MDGGAAKTGVRGQDEQVYDWGPAGAGFEILASLDKVVRTGTQDRVRGE
jgi:hypothetical protein